MPQILPFDFGESPINTGDMATVNCAVTKGDFPIKISWSFNGRTVLETPGITVGQINKRISTLSIDMVEAHHIGNYTCNAENVAGVDKFSAALNVNGTPTFCLAVALWYFGRCVVKLFAYLKLSENRHRAIKSR